jgi:hypothetical protein
MATAHRIHHRDRRVLETIFRHPTPGNLAWSEALHLIERLGTAQQEPNGKILLAIGEHRHVVHQPHAKELTREEVTELRKFLEAAGATPASVDVAEEEQAVEPATPDMLLTVDHHEARLFAIEGTSSHARTLRPYDPHHFLHHLTHRQERELRGQREPEESSYYAQIAAALAPARRIVVLGHGTGHSNAAAHLQELLRAKHPDIARRVVATKAVDLSAATEPQLLASAAELLDGSGEPASG